MTTFGLITEGLTDQQVIRAILDGFFDPDEVDAVPFLPIGDNTYKHQVASFSNWELVLEYCKSTQLKEAFPYVDYVIIQIDTDRCDEQNFGIRKEEDGVARSPADIVARVAAKLIETIGESVWSQYSHRIIFAIAVETTECWLLPLYALGKDKVKHLNCLSVLNRHLTRNNLRPLNSDAKHERRYADLADPYSKRRELMKHYQENPSLRIFVEKLISLFSAVPPAVPDTGTPSEAE